MMNDSHLMLRCGNLNCPYHINPQLEVLYVKEGRIVVSYENRRITVSSGEATVVLPYSIHSFEVDSGCDARVFMFSNAIADGIAANISFENKFSISAETDAFIEHILKKQTPNSIDVKALFYAFVCESPHINSEAQTKNEHLRSIVEWIYKNIGEKITLDDASKEFGISKRSLTSLFKNRLTITFNDFLSGIRVEKAKNMLLKNELTITQIAYECGFGSVRNFNRVFLRFAKCNPGEYKKLMK
ncbi:MAG: helix-turn-helix transcriptional regulator [Clostridia bacterium]|nr:helix-turn-helix transcriptional regulator [Clostridia bacterium]